MWKVFAGTMSVCLCGLGIAACGGGQDSLSTSTAVASGSGGLRAEDVRPTLAALPYKIRLKAVQPPGHDDGAFRGTALGPNKTKVEFSVGVGSDAFAVPLPGIGTMHAISNGEAGFAFNDYVSGGAHFKSRAQVETAIHMVLEMEERLCQKATGEPCPI